MTEVEKKKSEEKPVLIIDQQYIQDIAEVNVNRKLTEEEMQSVEDALYGFDIATSGFINDAVFSAIQYAVNCEEEV